MRRRSFLALAGTGAGASLAGCFGGGDADESAAADGSPGADGGTAEVAFGEGELTTDDPSAGQPDAYVDVVVENEGDGPSGAITVVADFLDEDGASLGEWSEELLTLRPGETWLVRAGSQVLDLDGVADFALDTDVHGGPPERPAGVDVVEHDLDTDRSTPWLSGTLANDRAEPLDSVVLSCRLLDDEGRVLTDSWEGTSDLEPGEDWAFEFPVSTLRSTAVADHDVVLDRDPWGTRD